MKWEQELVIAGINYKKTSRTCNNIKLKNIQKKAQQNFVLLRILRILRLLRLLRFELKPFRAIEGGFKGGIQMVVTM